MIENLHEGEYMKKSIRDLLALQAVDIRIRNLETRYKTIPVERANLVADENGVYREPLGKHEKRNVFLVELRRNNGKAFHKFFN